MAEILKEAKTKVIHRGERTIKETKEEDAIQYCERLYPETTKEFQVILDEMYETFCKKQRNYGPGNISVGTNLESDEDIKLSLVGLWFRMNDKIQRLKTLLLGGRKAAVEESMEDAYLDVSNYGIMAAIVARGKWGK